MKRRWLSIILLFVLVLGLVACAGEMSREEAAMSDSAVAPEYYQADGGFTAGAPAPAMEAVIAENALTAGETANLQPASQERLIIRTGDMTIVVTDTETAMAQIGGMAEGAGGWIVSSNVYQASETAKSGYMTVRIPAEGFQAFLDAVSALSVEVTNLSTSGQDVTEEYVDLDARLGNLEATAERVRGFLDEARTTEEALAVNAELSRLEGEIEAIRGRMKFLSESAAFSAVTVTLTPDELAQPIAVGGWQPQGVLKDAVEALISAMQALGSLAIWAVVFLLPVALLIAIPVALIVYLVRRRRTGKRQAPPAPPAA
jgi:hypothetical protein